MGLIAALLIPIMLFFWFAFSFTLWAWFKAIVHLCKLQFIRGALWFNAGVFMLFWWFDKPHDWDTMMPGIVFFTCLGALGTFVRWHRKRKAMQAMPTMPVWTPPAEAVGNIAPIIEVEYKRLPN
jgi:hypothetical protein